MRSRIRDKWQWESAPGRSQIRAEPLDDYEHRWSRDSGRRAIQRRRGRGRDGVLPLRPCVSRRLRWTLTGIREADPHDSVAARRNRIREDDRQLPAREARSAVGMLRAEERRALAITHPGVVRVARLSVSARCAG